MGIPEAEFTPRVRDAIMRLMAEVEQLRRELELAGGRINQLERLANEDVLAPINNRRAFVRELDRMMSYAERYGGSATLVFFDMNGLKQINDQFGHAAGDAAIQLVAKVLGDNIRRSDILGRLGGDEFGVILAQTDTKMAAQKAEQLAGAVRDSPLKFGKETIPLSVAYGCYTLVGGEDVARALEAADQAMYSRKRQDKAT